MPTKKSPRFEKVLQIPLEPYSYYLKQAQAEAGSLAAKLLAAIMRDYNKRQTQYRDQREALPPGMNDDGGIHHRVGIPMNVYTFYKEMGEREKVQLAPIFRAIIVNDYLMSMGLPVEDGLPAKKRDSGKGKMRGLIEASEERPIVKRKRGRPRKTAKKE